MDVALPEAVGIMLCLAAAAFFSLADAVVSVFGSARAEKEFEGGSARFETLASDPQRVSYSLALGKYASLLTAVVLVGTVIARGIPLWVGLPLVFLVILLVVEVGPRSMAHTRNRQLIGPLLRVLKPWVRVSRPVTWAMLKFEKIVTPQEKDDAPAASQLLEEDLAIMVNAGAKHAALTELKERILHSVFEFGDTVVREIMVPRTDVVAFPSDISFQDTLDRVNEVGHSRIPVYRESVDDVIGIFYVKDLLAHLANGSPDNFDITRLVRPAHFVPDTKHLNDLFKEFQRDHVHIAIVINEHGGTSGIVTLEDIIEEFFGEIHDEHDVEQALFAPLGDGRFLADARMPIDELEDLLGLDFPDDSDYDTLGGFIMAEVGRVPPKGTTVTMSGLRFTVTRATEKRVQQVEIKPETVVSSGSWQLH